MPANSAKSRLQENLPLVAGVLLTVLLLRLGAWQLDRADEKKALAEAFANPASVAQVTETVSPEQYQSLEARGRYLTDRQVLIDNAIVDSRLGYFVITPFEFRAGAPLLLVNRGWVPRSPASDLPEVAVGENPRNVRGRAGRLPRVGIRPGEAFSDKLAWPRVAVWPDYQEIAAEIGRDVLPWVLLLDADQADGFGRSWQPREDGTSTHYGYAFQWFAMAAAVLALTAWHSRRRWMKK